MANYPILQLIKLRLRELSKFFRGLATRKPYICDMDAANKLLETILAFCFPKCLACMSTGSETEG